MVDVNFVKCLVEQNTKEKNEETVKLCKELLPVAEPQNQATFMVILAK